MRPLSNDRQKGRGANRAIDCVVANVQDALHVRFQLDRMNKFTSYIPGTLNLHLISYHDLLVAARPIGVTYARNASLARLMSSCRSRWRI